MTHRLPTAGLFSRNCTAEQARIMNTDRFKTGANANGSKKESPRDMIYSENYTVVHSFFFKPSESRLPSENPDLKVDIGPFLNQVRLGIIEQFDHASVRVTKIVLEAALTDFWGPVGIKIHQETLNIGVPGEPPKKETVLECNTYMMRRQCFVTACIQKKLKAPFDVLENNIGLGKPFSLMGGVEGGVRSLVECVYPVHTPQDTTKRHWVVPAKSPLGLFFNYAMMEECPTEEKRREWREERCVDKVDANAEVYPIYVPIAEQLERHMIDVENKGIYLEDVHSGVHKFSIHVIPDVMPVTGERLNAEKIRSINPMIATDSLMPLTDEEIMERWNSTYQLTVSLRFTVESIGIPKQ